MSDDVKVHPRLDEAQITDQGLQALLRRHIEEQTGRKVCGWVDIISEDVQELGRLRHTAQCELWPRGEG